ncbi:MAG: hypothetical protein QGD94_00190, partial [Planctomycetia bacterium]|nr:hypothetical protein [Planctomycetia bacterium]
GALNIYIIDVGEAPTANVAIRGVRVTRSKISLEMPLKVAVEVVNYGTKAVKDVSVEMRIDDKPIGKIGDKAAKLSLAPGEMRMLEFPYTPYKNGVLTGEAWITAKEENAVDWDDHYWFCLEIREQVSVLCIDGDESGDHGESNAFRRALTAASAGSGQPFYSTRSVRSSKAADEVLAFYDVVALVNPGIIPPETIKAAVEFVEDGGGLLIFLGDLIRAESFQSLANAVLPESEKEEKFLPITMGETIDARQLTKAAVKLQQCDFNSPLFSVFRDPAAGDPTVLAAFKYRRLVFAEDAPIKVLASFSNGAPAIVEREFGMGKIIVVATTPNREWSNFPTKAVFVPFARAMVRAAQRSRLGSTPRYRFAGQVFQIVTKADRFAEDSDMVMLIKNPDDEELPSKEIPGDVQNRRLGRAGAKAGIYKLVLEPRKKPEKTDKKLVTKPLDAFVVVLPASESVLKRLDSQSIKESFGDNADAVHIVEMKEGWVESIESERKGRQLGWYAFAALLCLLTLEGLIAWLKKTTGGS